MKMMTMTVFGLMCLTTLAGFEREDPARYWNFEELCQVPQYRVSPYPESDFPGLKALLVKGKGPQGSEAEFFCYYGVPEGEKPAGGWPAAVMVHGGGGTAFPQLVALWKSRGFAVIALDWYNQRPAPGLTNVPPTEVSVPRVALAGGKRQDHVANVANMILSHTLIRSFSEVNGDRTVFLGLSWGSWYGACVAAADGRFKGVVEIYCGDKNVTRDPTTWMGFINGRFLHAAKVPMWWIVWPIDRSVTPASSNAGFAECPTFDGCTIVNRLGHSHAGLELDPVFRMARHYVGLDATRLPKLGQARLADGTVRARILDRGPGVAFARLGYTTSSDSKTAKRDWHYAIATVRGDEISAKLPVGTTCCYLAAYEKQTPRENLCGTTPYLILDAPCAAGEEGLADRFVAEAREAYASEPYRDYAKSVLDRKEYRGCGAGSRRNDVGGRVVRWVEVEGTANFRDIGGWTGLRTGRVYRGAEANCHTNAKVLAKLGIKCHNLFATEKGLRTLSEGLAVRTDLDLRGRGESPTPDATPIPGAQLVRIPCSSYTNFLRQTETVAKILRVFADERNYPVYVHCYGGADRTGSVCALLEGLCGVAEEDLSIDYELTSFSRLGRRPRYDRPYFFASMIRELKQRPGATLREQIEHFAVRECGLAPDEVTAIRRNLCDAGACPASVGSRRR